MERLMENLRLRKEGIQVRKMEATKLAPMKTAMRTGTMGWRKTSMMDWSTVARGSGASLRSARGVVGGRAASFESLDSAAAARGGSRRVRVRIMARRMPRAAKKEKPLRQPR